MYKKVYNNENFGICKSNTELFTQNFIQIAQYKAK